ncbi:MAG: sensor histidine kinase [Sandaracinaceae bacterium]|nr:sensor histidine kinase [Sandaracinaceae bacterium]
MNEIDRLLAGAEKAAVADELLGKLRHDVRNKLGSVRNAAFYLRKKVTQTPLWEEDRRVPSFFELIERAIDEAQAQVAALDGERVYTRRAQAVEVRGIVERLASAYGERLRADVSACVVTVDPVELELALRALIDNALDTGAGEVELRGRHEQSQLLISVSDRGPGIELDPVERALEPFVSTRPGRAGLGLSIARRIAHRYGGRLAIAESGPRGTRVEIALARIAPGKDALGRDALGKEEA